MISYTEEVALSMVQDVFDLFPYKHSKKPNLGKYKKEFISRWGPLKATSPVSLDLNSSISQDDSIASQHNLIASKS
jgi:hypothetical protein